MAKANNLHTAYYFAFGLILAFFLSLLFLLSFSSSILPLLGAVHAEPVFSPGSEDEILSLISSSQSSIDLEMYAFTNRKIADALSDAAKRGIQVRIILERRLDGDSAQEMHSYLSSGGSQVRWASETYTRTHSKFMVIDGRRVLVGSINFSNSAVKTNREADVILSGKIVEDFKRIFEEDWRIAI